MNEVSDSNKASYVNQLFDMIAPSYDAMNLLMTWGMLPIWRRKVMEASRTKPGDRALDVCCGSGDMTFQLAHRCGPFGGATGLDFSQEMLEEARKKQSKFTDGNTKFLWGDALDLPFNDNSFAAVTNGFALRNVVDINKCIQEMARVIRPGGRVVILEVSRPVFPINRAFFDIYYFKVVPWLGDHLVSGDAVGDSYSPYKWLAESLRNFPNRQGIQGMMEEAGLKDVEAKPLGFGAVTLYSGTKKSPLEADVPFQKRNALEDTIFKVQKLRKKLPF